MTRLRGMKYVQHHHQIGRNKSINNFTSWSWTYPRKLWLYLTSIVLPHSIPILNDEIELFIIGLVCYAVFGTSNSSHLNVLIASSFLLHFIRGVRWQLGFLYLSILFLLFFPQNPWYSKVSCGMFNHLALFLCLIFPMVPPVLADIEDQHLLNVGVQDIVLFLDNDDKKDVHEEKENGHSPKQQDNNQNSAHKSSSAAAAKAAPNQQGFIVRAYYPIDPSHHATSSRKLFLKDPVLYFLLIVCFLNMAIIMYPTSTTNTTPVPMATAINSVITAAVGLNKIDIGNVINSCFQNTASIATYLDVILSWLILLFFYILHQLLEIQSNVKLSPYVPEGNNVLQEMAKFAEMPSIIFSHMNLMKIHCEEDAPIANHAKRVLLFYPGLGGLRTSQVSLCMKAACEGYFVLCLESSDRTPSAIVLPPNNKKQAYQSFDDYKLQRRKQQNVMSKDATTQQTAHATDNSTEAVANINTANTADTGKTDEEIIGHEFRYNQMMIRTRESMKIMQFLEKYSATVSDSNTERDYNNNNFDGDHNNRNTKISNDSVSPNDDVYLSYVHDSKNPSVIRGNKLKWTRDVKHSLFWQSLQHHKFDTVDTAIVTNSGSIPSITSTTDTAITTAKVTIPIASSNSTAHTKTTKNGETESFHSENNNHRHHISPFLMGHSFGGATVLHLMADESIQAMKFRKMFPIAGCVIHDPWTVIPLSDQVKNMPNLSLSIPTLILQAEYFHYFYEYNIIQACQKVIFARIKDAGHHSFNDMGLLSPIVQRLFKNIGQQDPVVLNRCINNLSIQFLNQIRLANTDTDNRVTIVDTNTPSVVEVQHSSRVAPVNPVPAAEVTKSEQADFTPVIELMKQYSGFDIITCRI